MSKQCPSNVHMQRPGRIQVGTVLLQRMYNRYPRPTCFMSIRRWIDSERHRPRTAATTAAAAAAASRVFTGKTIGTCETRTGQANTLTASTATTAATAGTGPPRIESAANGQWRRQQLFSFVSAISATADRDARGTTTVGCWDWGRETRCDNRFDRVSELRHLHAPSVQQS